MKKILQKTIILLSILLVTFACTQNPIDPNKNIDGQNTNVYIVAFNNDGNSIQSSNVNANIKDIFIKHNIDLNALEHVYDYVLNGFAATLTEAQVLSLRYDKSIKYVTKDEVITLGDEFEGEIEKGRPGGNQPPSINWGVASVGGTGSGTFGTAWIVDTGIDFDHPDLNADQNLDYDYVNNDNVADDDNGHGTHCAGVIGCKNTTYTIGICPGAKVVGVKVLNSQGNGTWSNIIAGINYVAQNLQGGVNVVNMSFGGGIYTPIDDAVYDLSKAGTTGTAAKSVFICIAAGNEKKNAINYSPSNTGKIIEDNIYTISAHDNSNKFASFSNYGIPPVEYIAPGVTIFSCYKNGGYAWMSGTSMAAPHACGIILARNGSMNSSGTIHCTRDNKDYPKAHI